MCEIATYGHVDKRHADKTPAMPVYSVSACLTAVCGYVDKRHADTIPAISDIMWRELREYWRQCGAKVSGKHLVNGGNNLYDRIQHLFGVYTLSPVSAAQHALQRRSAA